MQEVVLPANDLRTPRLRVLADNTELPGVISAEVASNNNYAADRFRLTLSVSQTEAAAWSATDTALLDIQFSVDMLAWTSLIQGEVDQLHLDPRTGLLTLEGRDLTARLIEARTQATFANQTSSDIATALATRHGLAANVTATTTPVGAYWQLEHDRITLDSFSRSTTEWDLLVTMSGHEGFDVWISGTTLNFQPTQSSLGPNATLRPLATPGRPANILSIQLERSLTLARDIEVTVKSWNSRQSAAFSQTARATRKGSAGGGSSGKSPVQRYVYVVPNLAPDAALKLAQHRLAELTRHERVIHADMPGDLDLQPRQQVLLEGTGTDFDQVYTIDEIIRRIDTSHGFTQQLRARNSSVGSQATSPTNPIGGTPWTAS